MSEQFERRPKAIILKILGVCCTFKFETKLINFSIENCEQFIDKHFLDKNILNLIPRLKNFYHHIIKENKNCPTVSFDEFMPILNIEDENEQKKIIQEKNVLVNEFKKKLILFLIWSFQCANFSQSPINEIMNFIWESGYNEGKLKSDFYDDVPSKLKEWKDLGIKIYLMSSGTVHAQQIIFKNSKFGNLSAFLDGQISTTLIKLDKRDTYCYSKVSEIISEERKEILLISPSIHEIRAAFLCGFRVCLLRRVRKDETEDYKALFNVKYSLKEINFK